MLRVNHFKQFQTISNDFKPFQTIFSKSAAKLQLFFETSFSNRTNLLSNRTNLPFFVPISPNWSKKVKKKQKTVATNVTTEIGG